jgi:hypothetical protein
MRPRWSTQYIPVVIVSAVVGLTESRGEMMNIVQLIHTSSRDIEDTRIWVAAGTSGSTDCICILFSLQSWS